MDPVPSSRNRNLPPSRSKEDEAPPFPSKRFNRNSFFTEVSAKDGGSRGEDRPGRQNSFCTKGSTDDCSGSRGNSRGGSKDGSKEDLGVPIRKIIGGDGRGTEDDHENMGGGDGIVSCSCSEYSKEVFKAYEYKDRFDASASMNNLKDGVDSGNRGGSSKDGSREDLGISIGQIVDRKNFEVYEDKDGFNTNTVTNNRNDYLPTSLKDAHGKTAVTTNSDNVSSLADIDKNSNSDKERQKPQIASWLPWRDQRGILGKYTGQIDVQARPHGCGVIIYEDGSAVTSIWEGGVPIKSWVPRGVKNNKKQPHKQRSRSENNSSSSSSNCVDIAKVIAKKQQWQSSGRSSSSNSSSSSISSEDVEGSSGNPTYLPHLDLGDVGAPRDMIHLKSGRSVAFETLDSQLRTLDFAFVLRSDGRWTYAIVAEKLEDFITFVVDGEGRTKTVSRRRWSGSIRLVNPHGARRSCWGGDCGNSGSEGSNGSKREEEAFNEKRSRGQGPSQTSISI